MNKSSKIFYGNLTYKNVIKEYLNHNKILKCNHIVHSELIKHKPVKSFLKN